MTSRFHVHIIYNIYMNLLCHGHSSFVVWSISGGRGLHTSSAHQLSLLSSLEAIISSSLSCSETIIHRSLVLKLPCFFFSSWNIFKYSLIENHFYENQIFFCQIKCIKSKLNTHSHSWVQTYKILPISIYNCFFLNGSFIYKTHF